MKKPNETGYQDEKNTRPPIVVVMGHVDHGKTTILDYYRKSKVVDSESGGITQHIGAYEVEHKGKKITFIDTPGHEAFSKMRARGAKIADIAILVIAAEEGVKPQTKEALTAIKEQEMPFVVAMNKIDKPEANPERVKQELAKEDVLLESYGGKTPSAEVSAKTGKNMDELLELVLLVAELEDLKANPESSALGTIVETHLDSKRGITATLLVQNGTLRRQNVLALDHAIETIKIMEDFRGEKIEQAGPSTPVVIAGFKETPPVGETFHAFSTKGAAEEFIHSTPVATATETQDIPLEEGRPVFNVILKADVAGSKEAVEDAIKKLASESIGIHILRSEIGDISESDAKLAMATKMVTIVGFKVKIDAAVRELAEKSAIRVVTGDVIYELVNKIKEKMESMLPPKVKRNDVGRVKILKVFKRKENQQVVGGRVEDGRIIHNGFAEIIREKKNLGRGAVRELQQNKQKVDAVEKGLEFGVMIETDTSIQEGDVLGIFEEEIIKRRL